MVTIINAHLREGERGKFVSLELQGDIELVQSQSTGRFYGTTRRCFISSTFDEQTAKALVGSKLPGSIIRYETEPYEYIVPETGERLMLSYKWDYSPDEQNANTARRTSQTAGHLS